MNAVVRKFRSLFGVCPNVCPLCPRGRWLKKPFRTLAGLRQEYRWILELGFIYVELQEKVSRIVKSMKYFSKPIPVDVPFIRKHMGVRAKIVVEMNAQEPMAELFQNLKTRPLDVIVTRIVTEPDGITAEFRQESF